MWERKRQWLGWVGPRLTLSRAPFPSRPVALHPAFAVDDITGFANTLREFPAFQRQADWGRQWATWAESRVGSQSGHKGHTRALYSFHNLPRVLLLSFQSPFLGQMSTVHAVRVMIQTAHGMDTHALPRITSSAPKRAQRPKVKGIGREREAAWGAALNGPGTLAHCILQPTPALQPRCFSPLISLWGQGTSSLSTVSSGHSAPEML